MANGASEWLNAAYSCFHQLNQAEQTALLLINNVTVL